MTTEVVKIPSLADLTLDVSQAFKEDAFNALLNQQPPEAWVKEHPHIPGWKYLPIDKTEHMLRKIFKVYRIEVLKTGMLMNAVEVTVRVHFKNPVSGEWGNYDGVGACELQTKKDTGTLKLDMSNVSRGAVSMALPIAKTLAIKDACDHFGSLFGANLNRKDVLDFVPDQNLKPEDNELTEAIRNVIAKATKEQLTGIYEVHKNQFGGNPEFMQLLNKRKEELA